MPQIHLSEKDNTVDFYFQCTMTFIAALRNVLASLQLPIGLRNADLISGGTRNHLFRVDVNCS